MTATPVPIAPGEPTGVLAGYLSTAEAYPPYRESPVKALSFRRREVNGVLGLPYETWLGPGEARVRLPVGDWHIGFLASKRTRFAHLARARVTVAHTERAPLRIDGPLTAEESWTPDQPAPDTAPVMPAHVVAYFIDIGERPTEGEVRFEPLEADRHPSAIVAHSTVVAPIVDGVARRELLPGRYRVTYRLVGSSLPGHTIDVGAEHTLDAPLNLATVSSAIGRPLPTH